jgi:hypothetical protein
MELNPEVPSERAAGRMRAVRRLVFVTVIFDTIGKLAIILEDPQPVWTKYDSARGKNKVMPLSCTRNGMLRTGLLQAVACGFALLHCSDSNAQVKRYQPSTPTLSPYLNLSRGNLIGGLPNYFTFVRPEQQQQAINRREQDLRLRQQSEIQQLQFSLREAERQIAPTGHRSWFMTGSSRAGYLNTSRFYAQAPSSAGARRTGAR